MWRCPSLAPRPPICATAGRLFSRDPIGSFGKEGIEGVDGESRGVPRRGLSFEIVSLSSLRTHDRIGHSIPRAFENRKTNRSHGDRRSGSFARAAREDATSLGSTENNDDSIRRSLAHFSQSRRRLPASICHYGRFHNRPERQRDHMLARPAWSLGPENPPSDTRAGVAGGPKSPRQGSASRHRDPGTERGFIFLRDDAFR